MRAATVHVEALTQAEVAVALQAADRAADAAKLYRQVGMRNASRSYFVRSGNRLHSLKAVVAYALQQSRSAMLARDFHAVDAVRRLRELGFDVVHHR